MIKVYEWEDGNGYNVELSFEEAVTLRNALDQALENQTHIGSGSGEHLEIEVEIIL